MYENCRLSDVTKSYLSRYHCILDEMTENMTSAELTDSISHNFIVQMIPHHKAAIEMSENILKYTTFLPVQKIAQNIIDEQTKSIKNMQKIESECEKHINSKRDICLYNRRVNKILQTMFNGMEIAAVSNDINADFMREMIPHHAGAVELSENALRYDICKELYPILNSITVSQKRGISQMRHLLKYLCCNRA